MLSKFRLIQFEPSTIILTTGIFTLLFLKIYTDQYIDKFYFILSGSVQIQEF